MQATVKKIEEGRLIVRVRRNYRHEVILYSADAPFDSADAPYIRVGSKIECERRPNNPYLQFVRVITT